MQRQADEWIGVPGQVPVQALPGGEDGGVLGRNLVEGRVLDAWRTAPRCRTAL